MQVIRIVGRAVTIHGTSAAVVLGHERILDLPLTLFGADTELKVFTSNGVPILELCLLVGTFFQIS